MRNTKKTVLKPLLESNKGIHLTVYLVNRGDLVDLKTQLREAINQCYEWVNPVLSIDDRNKFLEPLDALLEDARIFNEMKGNIGIFRNQESFRLLNIPVDVEPTCQVATSFHVKPLLKWMQSDQEFLLLGLSQESIDLYIGSQSTLKLIDSLFFADNLIDKKFKEKEIIFWLSGWVSEIAKHTKPKLYMAGEKAILKNVARALKYRCTVKKPVSKNFSEKNLNHIVSLIRNAIKVDSRKVIEKCLFDFRLAEQDNRVQKNIFQIARSAVQGRVRKLLVSYDFNIYGKIDRKSGDLVIHPFDLDHEDDDILDDLAQMVLSQGGEVVVASHDEIPKGRPILAILEQDEKELEKSKNVGLVETLLERYG
jgi:hypothetical protein